METDVYTGTLSLKNIYFTFVFDKQELRLIPPQDKKREVDLWFLKALGGGVYTMGDPIYVETPLVSAKCNECYQIIFLPSYHRSVGHINSVVVIDIQAYIIYNSRGNGIKKISFECPEINSIYSTRQAIETKRYSDGVFEIKTLKIDTSNEERQFFNVDGKDVEVYFDIIQKTTQEVIKPPLSLQSCMCFRFDPTCDIDFINKLHQIARCFMEYVCYRKDIFFQKIQIYTEATDNTKMTFQNGEFFVVGDKAPIDEQSIKDGRCIKHYYIAEAETSILTAIAENTLYMRHLPESREAGQHINAARFVMITAAFEWEFKKLYPSGLRRKDASIKAEEAASQVLTALINESKGKLKDLYKSLLKNGIGFAPLQAKMVQVGKDLDSIISPFGKYLCAINKKELNYSKMGERLASQRNHYAHGDLDEEFIGDSLLDLIFLERILYAMQLKRFGVSEKNIQHSINDLFHCNIAIED